jgi:hypothetical protein
LVAGVIIVPGAVVALLRPKGRKERAWAVFVGTFAILLLAEAAVYSANSSEFKERYLFALLPLLPIAFGLYLKRERPLRPVVITLAAIIAVVAARLPVSAYTASTFKMDSQFLMSMSYFERDLGVGSTSLLVAAVATVGALVAVIVAYRGVPWLALGGTLAIAVTVTAGAVAQDLKLTRSVRASLPRDLTWIDDASTGAVTAVATPLSPQKHLLDALFWNDSVQREVVLDDGQASDVFAAPELRIARDGALLNAGRQIVFDDSGSTAILANATRLAASDDLTLWRARTQPRFRLLIEDRYPDSWLSQAGSIRAWPLRRDRSGTAVRFTLSLPSRRKAAVHLSLGPTLLTVRPGMERRVVCTNQRGPLDVRFSSPDAVLTRDLRALTVRLSRVRVVDAPFRASAANIGTCRAVT